MHQILFVSEMGSKGEKLSMELENLVTVVTGAGTEADPYRTVYWVDRMQYYRPDVSFYGSESGQALSGKGLNEAFGTWSLRLGARFSF